MNKVEVFIRRLIARYLSPVVEIIYRVRFKFISFKEPPIIILTPGKVGSSSVYHTLKSKLDNPVFHIHRLSEKGIKNSIEEHLQSDRKSKPLHLIVSNLLRKKLNTYHGEIYVVSIIREPVSRSISAFFQNTEIYKNKIEKSGLEIDSEKALSLLSIQLKNGITTNIEKWFEEEIHNNFGIDVFNNDFNIKKGYEITNIGRVKHLLIKMEVLNEQFSVAMDSLLENGKSVKLDNTNIGDQKHYSESYNIVKNRVMLDSETINDVVSSKYFQKFYKEKEKDVRKKWT